MKRRDVGGGQPDLTARVKRATGRAGGDIVAGAQGEDRRGPSIASAARCGDACDRLGDGATAAEAITDTTPWLVWKGGRMAEESRQAKGAALGR